MQIKLCYFNQHWNIYFYTEGGYDSWMNDPEQKVITDETGEYRLRTYQHPVIPIYSFGYMYNEENKSRRPGHQGEWSSNSTAINPVFGVNLYEVGVDNISVAVPMDWLKAVLGDQVVWEKHPIYREWIKEVKGVNPDYMKWAEVSPQTLFQ